MKTTILFFIACFLFVGYNSYSQTNPGYSGDESKCPYLHPASSEKTILVAPTLIDDFESMEKTLKQWSNPMESGTMKSSIDLSDSAHAGKKGAKISFAGNTSKGSWTNLQCKTTLPADKNKITFWAKAESACTLKITVYQGLLHNEMEIFSKTINLNTKWQKYEVSINEISEILFSHPLQDGGKASSTIDKGKVFAIGFAEHLNALTFYLDNLQLE